MGTAHLTLRSGGMFLSLSQNICCHTNQYQFKTKFFFSTWKIKICYFNYTKSSCWKLQPQIISFIAYFKWRYFFLWNLATELKKKPNKTKIKHKALQCATTTPHKKVIWTRCSMITLNRLNIPVHTNVTIIIQLE